MRALGDTVAPVIPIDGEVGPGWPRRFLDLVVAVLGLVLCAPLLLAAVLAVRMSGPGPVLFRQARVGQGGRPFNIYKLRTMHHGMPGPDLTAAGDRRVTRVGHLLRSTSIDELPQLVNVLIGHMTLVGPRPETVKLAARYPESCRDVFRYRPGLTGPTQLAFRDENVLGLSATDLESYYLTTLVPARTGVDLEFLARPTLARTLGVLVATVLFILHAPGAEARWGGMPVAPEERVPVAPTASRHTS